MRLSADSQAVSSAGESEEVGRGDRPGPAGLIREIGPPTVGDLEPVTAHRERRGAGSPGPNWLVPRLGRAPFAPGPLIASA